MVFLESNLSFVDVLQGQETVLISLLVSFQGKLVVFKERKHTTSFVILTGPQEMSCWVMMLQVINKFFLSFSLSLF